MANRNKVASAIAAVGVAAAMALGGTFAWQSISQTALNEASDVVNPGGRLHDDFDGTNKDVYVENFADEPIIARIRLAEYFEVIANHGVKDAEKSTSILGSKSVADGKTTYSYETFKGYSSLKDGVVSAGLETTGTGEAATTRSYWSWKTGGQTMYMPTFNKNKDSMAADLNGIYEDGSVGTISDRDGTQYTDYVDYSLPENATKTADAVYDADANSVEEKEGDAGFEGSVSKANETHTAKQTGTAALMSMADWIGEGAEPGPYWVYDTDGWVYWAQPIGKGEATGLLLDSIELNQVMDDTWYYAIDVTAQFATPDDVGYEDGTGFYGEGERPSMNAERLLRALGADIPVSYVMSGATPLDGYPDEDKVLVMEDPDSGVTLTFVRVGDPISVEELESSYYMAGTTTRPVGDEAISQYAPVYAAGEAIPGDGPDVDAYSLAKGGLMLVTYIPDYTYRWNGMPFQLPKPGVYLPHLGPVSALESQGLSSFEAWFCEYDPDPTVPIETYETEGRATATLRLDGSLAFTGEGSMPSSGGNASPYPEGFPWSEKNTWVRSVRVEEGVTTVSEEAFGDYLNLESVWLSGTVSLIEKQAFRASSVESVVIEGEVDIAEKAFLYCGSLRSVEFAGYAASVGWQAFSGCDSLVSVSFPEGLISLGHRVFSNCDNLESVRLPASLESMDQTIFDGCPKMKTIYYAGTKAQWEAIEKKDDVLEDGAEIVCSDGTITVGQ